MSSVVGLGCALHLLQPEGAGVASRNVQASSLFCIFSPQLLGINEWEREVACVLQAGTGDLFLCD